MKKTLVIYHGDCTDGLGSAYSAWKKLGEEAWYMPYHHQKDLTIEKLKNDIYQNIQEDLSQINLYVLDFSFPLHIWTKLREEFQSVQMIDHHQSAYDGLKNEKDCFFDLTHCGSYLAWKYFHPHQEIPQFIHLIEDFDLFQMKLENTSYFYRGLNLQYKDFRDFNLLEDEVYLSELIAQGKILQKYFMTQVTSLLKNKIDCSIDGVKGLMLNAPGIFASEIGHILSKETNFVMIWSQSKDMIKCSLRSSPDFDCSVIAKKFGGGGHPCASAFTMDSMEDFLKIIDNKNMVLKIR